MPKLDLLLLPLICGYLFLSQVSVFKFYLQRVDKQRLIFDSLITGFVISTFLIIIDEFFLKLKYIIVVREFLGKLIEPFESLGFSFLKAENFNIYSLIIIGTLLLSLLINLIFSNNFSYNFAISKYGNEFDKLLWNSLKSKKDEDKLIMLTTKSLKVYVGYITKISNPINADYVSIVPNFSGFRKKDTLEFVITTNYLNVIKKYLENNQKSEIIKNMGITIPRNEIISLSRFDIEVFKEFNKSRMNKEKQEKPVEKDKLKIKGTFDDVLKASVPKPKERGND